MRHSSSPDFGFTEPTLATTLNAVRVDMRSRRRHAQVPGVASSPARSSCGRHHAGNLVFTPDAASERHSVRELHVQRSRRGRRVRPRLEHDDVQRRDRREQPTDRDDGTVTTASRHRLDFRLADFGFIDPDAGDMFSAVQHRHAAATARGPALRFGRCPSSPGRWCVAGIAAGNLVFTPVPASGARTTSFDFTSATPTGRTSTRTQHADGERRRATNAPVN